MPDRDSVVLPELESAPDKKVTFADLGLSAPILASVEMMGYTNPTPVQEQAIPLVLAGRDVVASAQTGTGKTAAFCLPILDQLGHAPKKGGPLCLVVTPTRELAQQIDKVAFKVGRKTGHKVFTVVGGVGYNPQVDALRRGLDVLVATPGRLLDLVNRGNADLSHVEYLVLDEADRMMDMGFWPDIKTILEMVPKKRQTMLFSATINNDVLNKINTVLDNPEFVEISRVGTTAETIDQYLLPVSNGQKNDLLEAALEQKGAKRVIIFTRTKYRADTTARRLEKLGYKTESIHGDRSQSQRMRALDQFRKGRVEILVATDVLARGIDVSDVDHVINFDIPTMAEDYVHRIGRTGRAGEDGFSLSFVTSDEIQYLNDIERLLNKAIPLMDLDFNYDSNRPHLDPNRDVTKKSRGGKKGNGRSGGGKKGGRGRSSSQRGPKKPRSNDSRAPKPRGDKPAGGRGEGRSSETRTENKSSFSREGSKPRSDNGGSRGFKPRSNDSRSKDSRGGEGRSAGAWRDKKNQPSDSRGGSRSDNRAPSTSGPKTRSNSTGNSSPKQYGQNNPSKSGTSRRPGDKGGKRN